MSLLDQTLAAIRPPDAAARRAVSERLDQLTKPQGSLGQLETIVQRYAAIRHDANAAMGRKSIAVFVADHGVAAARVSAYPPAVTLQMLGNLGAGGAAISVLARHFGFDLIVTDVGVATDTSANPLPGVHYRRVGAGTQNFLEGPAMTPAEAAAALNIGIETVRAAAVKDTTLLGIGEMGIGNSTSAAAILAALTGLAPERLAGRGTGVDEGGLGRKIKVIAAALELHRVASDDGLAALTRLGGFEIAAMAGVCLGGAAAHIPVVVDGFIATAAAMAAERIAPGVCAHLFFGHLSAEGGHALALAELGARPLLDLEMRLGEGTGAALALSVIDAAVALFHSMATFAGAGVAGKE